VCVYIYIHTYTYRYAYAFTFTYTYIQTHIHIYAVYTLYSTRPSSVSIGMGKRRYLEASYGDAATSSLREAIATCAMRVQGAGYRV
jgi:hypothetical protein